MFNTNKSLSSILSSFNKTIDDLDKLVESNSIKISDNQEKIDTLQGLNKEMTQENNKANSIKDKIQSLIS